MMEALEYLQAINSLMFKEPLILSEVYTVASCQVLHFFAKKLIFTYFFTYFKTNTVVNGANRFIPGP